jgi:nicotinamide-nucleotide amidase
MVPDDKALEQLAVEIVGSMTASSLMLATAESCTGGWVSKLITDISGSSAVLDRGFVTYSNEAKQEMLGVPAEILDAFGAVSAETVTAMALGAIECSRADIAVAISGIAGPGGGSEEKPVGTVFIAWADRSDARVERAQFDGDRESIRRQAAGRALQGVLESLER